jgi:hypothetical protein
MSGDGKRAGAQASVLAPILGSTQVPTPAEKPVACNSTCQLERSHQPLGFGMFRGKTAGDAGGCADTEQRNLACCGLVAVNVGSQ